MIYENCYWYAYMPKKKKKREIPQLHSNSYKSKIIWRRNVKKGMNQLINKSLISTNHNINRGWCQVLRILLHLYHPSCCYIFVSDRQTDICWWGWFGVSVWHKSTYEYATYFSPKGTVQSETNYLEKSMVSVRLSWRGL